MDIEEEENALFIVEGEIEDEANKYELCVVGRFLTARNINVHAMKTKMADIWTPSMRDQYKRNRTRYFSIPVLLERIYELGAERRAVVL